VEHPKKGGKMIKLTEKQISDYFHRSYTAVDGLWFMKVEEKYGFDSALEIDREVWKVLPKIQARFLKSLSQFDTGIVGLFECFTTKLKLEGFEFRTEGGTNELKIIISRCPWHDTMIKSGREDLSEKVGNVICNTEYSVWASEFGGNIRFEQGERICNGSENCILTFSYSE